jgi:acyl-CoA hydrolase
MGDGLQHVAARRRALARVAGLAGLATAPWLAACGKSKPKAQAVPRGATVLALGDSLTYGTGATPETSYPAVLAGLTGWSVVNAGVPGDTSTQARERLPALLAEYKPVLVIVCIGGNDFLRTLSEVETRAQVRATCEEARASGAQVMLVAVPRVSALAAATGSLSDHAMYGEIAAELKLPLHGKGWSGVLGDASLRSDQVHANAKGYERFANELYKSLKDAGFTG